MKNNNNNNLKCSVYNEFLIIIMIGGESCLSDSAIGSHAMRSDSLPGEAPIDFSTSFLSPESIASHSDFVLDFFFSIITAIM